MSRSKKKCPEPKNLNQNRFKTHFFVTNLRVRDTFLTPCVLVRTLRKNLEEETRRFQDFRATNLWLQNPLELLSSRTATSLS